MKTHANIAQVFPKYLFWDMDVTKLDVKRDKDIIIPRAFYASTPNTFASDIERLENFYSPSEIVKALKSTKERISDAVCRQVAARYKVAPFSRFAVAA